MPDPPPLVHRALHVTMDRAVDEQLAWVAVELGRDFAAVGERAIALLLAAAEQWREHRHRLAFIDDEGAVVREIRVGWERDELEAPA